MAITYIGKPAASAVPHRKKKSGHTEPKRPAIALDEPGRLRVSHFQYLLGGISHSAFYERLKRKRIPGPDGHDPRPYWNCETVRRFLQG